MSEPKCRLGDLAQINPESLGIGTPSDYSFKYIDISSVMQGIINWSRVQSYQFRDAPSRARRIVRHNDVLICTVRPGLQAHCFIDKSDYGDLIASTGFAVVRCGSDINPRYLFYSLFGSDIPQQLRKKETGSNYPAVNERDIQDIIICCPAIKIQNEIAHILDTLDEAIQKTEQLIAKLKAIKQGMLHDLLTRGLDENGQLRDPVAHPEQFKPSPLGPIPKEWEIKEIGELATLEYGAGLTENKRSGIGYPVYGSNGIVGYHDTFLIQGPGIIVGRKGSVGSIHWSSDSFWPIDTTYYVNAKEEIGLRWFYWALQYSDLDRLDSSTGVPGLNRNDAYKIKLYKPKYSEQNQIASILDTLENTIAKHEQNYLSKLRLLKKGLMHDLLTGKVRVNIKAEESEHEDRNHS